MPASTVKGDRVPIKLWAPPHELDSNALKQLKAIAGLPWVAHHVAVMPDVHAGKGATVGSVIALRGAVSPAAVGVDIGCGMSAVKSDLRAEHLPDNLRDLRLALEAAIPVGGAHHQEPAFTSATPELARRAEELFSRFRDLDAGVHRFEQRAALQLGSLGGGNHFIEVCLDTDGFVWLMLHSGSRHVGAALAERHMSAARRLFHNRDLPDPDLAVFLAGTPTFDAYRLDLGWAQEYARLNRDLMLERAQRVLREHFEGIAFEAPISCHHNYVADEIHFGEELVVTRKGAIRAALGELGLIPGSMGSKSYVVRGLGNPHSFESASHGAGRRMSRTQARRRYSVRDLELQTKGVECRKDRGVLDEAPKAYKNIDRVMEQQADLVEVVAELKQVVCVKG